MLQQPNAHLGPQGNLFPERYARYIVVMDRQPQGRSARVRGAKMPQEKASNGMCVEVVASSL